MIPSIRTSASHSDHFPTTAIRPDTRLRDGLLLFGAVFLLYALTAAPTVTWDDGADLALRTYDWGVDPERALRSYIFYRAIGKLFLFIPVGDVAFRTTLLSVFFGALTVAVTYWNLLDLTGGKRLASLAGAASLAVCHLAWFFSTVTEVYSLSNFLAAMLCFLLTRWEVQRRPHQLLLGALFLGLSISHHGAGAILVPGMCFFFLARRRDIPIKLWVGAVALTFVGAALFFYGMAEVLINHEAPPSGHYFVDGIGGHHIIPWKKTLQFLGLLMYQFPFAAFFLGLYGLAKARRNTHAPVAARTIALFFGTISLWGIAFWSPAPHNQYISTVQYFAVAIGLGFAALLDRPWFATRAVAVAASLLVLPVPLYAITPRILTAKHINIANRKVPNRDANRFFLFPPKPDYRGCRAYAEEALDEAAPGSTIFADYTVWRPLRYMQVVEGRRPDVNVQFVEQWLVDVPRYLAFLDGAKTPVYHATDDPPANYGVDEAFLRRFERTKQKWLVRVTKR